MLPAIARLDGSTVHLVDGSSVEADVIVCATGYEMSFPFFDSAETDLHPDDEHRYPLFKRMIKPGVDHLFYLGLAQSSPTIVNLAEQQSKLLAKLLDGTYALPSVEEQERIMRADEAAHLEQYYDAPRHTIQIDFGRYCLDLHAEIAAGEERAASPVERDDRRMCPCHASSSRTVRRPARWRARCSAYRPACFLVSIWLYGEWDVALAVTAVFAGLVAVLSGSAGRGGRSRRGSCRPPSSPAASSS